MKLIVISGPAGSGKNTIVSLILQKYKDRFEETISCTTRLPREGEVHGVHYHFLEKDEFEKKIENEEFHEWALVHNQIYFGTLKNEPERIIKKGKTPISILDVQGALNIKKKHPKVLTVFIMPEGIHIVNKRLEERGHHTEQDIKNRLKSAEKELALSCEYDFIITNREGQLDKTVEEILKIIS